MALGFCLTLRGNLADIRIAVGSGTHKVDKCAPRALPLPTFKRNGTYVVYVKTRNDGDAFPFLPDFIGRFPRISGYLCEFHPLLLHSIISAKLAKNVESVNAVYLTILVTTNRFFVSGQVL